LKIVVAAAASSAAKRFRGTDGPTHLLMKRTVPVFSIGVLFELATNSPEYTVDEDISELSEWLVLPGWLEDRREEIEAGLPALSSPPSSE
jgi:hypothetical protein